MCLEAVHGSRRITARYRYKLPQSPCQLLVQPCMCRSPDHLCTAPGNLPAWGAFPACDNDFLYRVLPSCHLGRPVRQVPHTAQLLSRFPMLCMQCKLETGLVQA